MKNKKPQRPPFLRYSRELRGWVWVAIHVYLMVGS